MNDFKDMLGEVAAREARASGDVDSGGYVRTVGRRRAVRHVSQGAVAVAAMGTLAYGAVTVIDFDPTQTPGGVPTTPTADVTPDPAPSASPAPSVTPDVGQGDISEEPSLETAWGTPWPSAMAEPVDPETTSEEGWQVWSKYVGSIASPMCGQAYDRSLLDTDSYYNLEGDVRNRAPGAGQPFEFVARITNQADVDLSSTTWQGPLVMFLDGDGVVAAFMHLDPTTVDGPEHFDGPDGSFAVGESVEVFGRQPAVRACPDWADVEPYLATVDPGPSWPTTDTVPLLAAGEYEVVMQMSAPFAYDLVVEGVDVSQDLPPMKAVSLGRVRVH